MINATKFGKSIINAFFNTKVVNGGMSVSFPATPYLALFTTMPTVTTNGNDYVYTPGVEVQENTESANKTYRRVLLTSVGVSQKRLIAEAEIVGDSTVSADDKTKDAAAGFDVGSARIKNQDLIFFPEAEKEAYGTIVGFGIFDNLTGGVPYIFGNLSSDSGNNGTVTVNINEIPIFRVGDFRIALS